MWTRSATTYHGVPWITAAVLLCPAVSSAAAEDPFNRFYFGFAGGYSSGFQACNAFSSDFVPGKCGEDDIGWKFFGVRGEWQRFFGVGSAIITGEPDIDLFTLGLVFRF